MSNYEFLPKRPNFWEQYSRDLYSKEGPGKYASAEIIFLWKMYAQLGILAIKYNPASLNSIIIRALKHLHNKRQRSS